MSTDRQHSLLPTEKLEEFSRVDEGCHCPTAMWFHAGNCPTHPNQLMRATVVRELVWLRALTAELGTAKLEAEQANANLAIQAEMYRAKGDDLFEGVVMLVHKAGGEVRVTDAELVAYPNPWTVELVTWHDPDTRAQVIKIIPKGGESDGQAGPEHDHGGGDPAHPGPADPG